MGEDPDGGGNGASRDAGVVDGAVPVLPDAGAGPGPDASLSDAGSDDGGEPDSAAPDADVGETEDAGPDAHQPGTECTAGEVQTRTRFASDYVPAGESCEAEVQTRGCSDGWFEPWTGSFPFETCTRAPAACEGVPHGTVEWRTRYATPFAHTAGTCVAQAQTRSCDDGTFSAWSGTYTYDQCDEFSANTCPSAHGPELEWNLIDENCDGKLGRHLEA